MSGRKNGKIRRKDDCEREGKMVRKEKENGYEREGIRVRKEEEEGV